MLIRQAYIFDFTSFAHLLKIRHKTERKLVSFAPSSWYPAQKYIHNIWSSIEEAGGLQWFLILKARQEGISTYVESRIFHSTVTHPHTNALILADKQARSEYIYQMCKTMYEYLPEEYKPQARYSTKRELVFDTKDGRGLKSAIYVSTALDQFIGQAMTLHLVHVSEASSFPYLQDVLTTLIPAVPQTPESIVVIESTAKGAGHEFHQEWLQAEAGQSVFHPVFIPWFMMSEYSLAEGSPLYEEYAPTEYTKYEKTIKKIAKQEYGVEVTDGQLAWRRFQIERVYRGDEDSCNQEMPSTAQESFIVAGRTAFPKKRLKEMYMNRQPPIERAEIEIDGILDYDIRGHLRQTPNGRLWIWKHPVRGHIYRIGVDPASGLEGRDYTAFEVFDEIEKEQVAEFQGHLDPFQTAHQAIVLAHYYNDAKLAIEINYGLGTQIEAKRYYWNFYRHKYLDRLTDRPTEKIGFLTTYSFKKELIGYAEHAINTGIYKIYSERLISELMTFIQRPGQELASAAAGCTDDLVMATCICWYTSYQDRDYLGYAEEKITPGADSEVSFLTALYRENRDEETEFSYPSQQAVEGMFTPMRAEDDWMDL